MGFKWHLRRNTIIGSFCLQIIKQLMLAANEQFGAWRQSRVLFTACRTRGRVWGLALDSHIPFPSRIMAPFAKRKD